MGSFKYKAAGDTAEVRRSTRSSARLTKSKKRVLEQPAAGAPPAKKARRSRAAATQKKTTPKTAKRATEGEKTPTVAKTSPQSKTQKKKTKPSSRSKTPVRKATTPKQRKREEEEKQAEASPAPAVPVKDVPELEEQIAKAVMNHTAKPAVTIPLYIKQHLRLFGHEMAKAVIEDLPRLTPELDPALTAPSPYEPTVQEATEVLKRKEVTLDAYVTTLLEQKQEWEEVRRVYDEKRKQNGEAKELTNSQRESLRVQVLADVEVSTDLTSFDSSLQDMASMLNDLNDALSHIRSLNMAGAEKVKALSAQLRNRAFKDHHGWENSKRLMEQIGSTDSKKKHQG